MKQLIALAALTACHTAGAATLTVKAEGFDNSDGFVRIQLAASEAAWQNQEKAHSARVEKAVEGTMTLTFNDLPAGTYALRLIHDENGNDQLDTNMVGIPKEGYGFSNDAGSFGPAKWKDAAFEVTESGSDITIRVR